MRVMHPPTGHFQKKIFDAYNFSIISNLFDSDKSYDSDKPCYEEAQTRQPCSLRLQRNDLSRYTSTLVFLFHTPNS